MKVARLDFFCRFTSPAVLDSFKGSVLHGALGRAFRQTCCALRRKKCEECLLRSTCPYALVFEGRKGGEGFTLPHPYALIPPEDPRNELEQGDRIGFSLILFGPALSFIPHMLQAVMRMGELGLGSRRREGYGRFKLEEAFMEGVRIYSRREGVVEMDQGARNLSLEASPLEDPGKILVRLLTPLRVKYRGEFQDRLTFDLLARSALRRISFLEKAYGSGEPEMDYGGVIKRASLVTTERDQIRWQECPRYSARQRTRMSMGGMVGEVIFAGPDLAQYLPLLNYCQEVGLGKQTAFGHGRIAVEELR